MRVRTVRGIVLLLGLSSGVSVGCSASGGAATLPADPVTSAGGASASAGSGGAAGSAAESDGSSGEGGASFSDSGSSHDAIAADGREEVADAATDMRADAADVSVGSDAGGPDVRAESGSDVSVDTRPGTDAVADGRADVTDVVVDRRSVADAPSSGKTCVEHCNADDDCKPTLPVAEFECDLETHRCVVCRNDLACVAAASGWIVGCTKSSDCGFVGDVCIEVNGAGKCAFSKAVCAGEFPDDIPAREFPTGTAVTVCGLSTSECHAGRCVDRCGPMHTCTPQQGGKACNPTTGRCECTDDNDCSGGVGVSKCNTATQQCECAGNADCIGVEDVDVCVDGKCRCSNVSVCKADFTGTTLSCE